MTNIGRGIAITGTVRSEEPLAIAGRIKGDVVAAEHEVTLETGSDIDGAVMARTIVVLGKSSGRLVGRDAVRLRQGSSVQAEVATPHFSMEDGAVFNGRVDPVKVDAAFKVADYRETKEEPKPRPPSVAADKGR